MLALLLSAGIASMFYYDLFFKFVGAAVVGGAFLAWVLRS
ncbi:hypothetical protein CPT_Snoke_039 [Escherichia phage Snoke]|nr:hypothetical protein CPT_Snoke_039 [Escherichia phage Snoke]